MGKASNELKVGIFVILAICAGVFLWTKTQNMTASEIYRLKTCFNFAGGLKENGIVTLSGIEVGRIEKINFIYKPETKIEVTLGISKKAKVRTDSIAYITTSGIIGDSFIGITPGNAECSFAKPDSVITGEDPIQMRELMKKAESIAQNLDSALVDVKKLAGNLNGAIEDNRGKIDNIIVNLEKTSVNFNEFSDDIKKHPWKLLQKGK